MLCKYAVDISTKNKCFIENHKTNKVINDAHV